MIRTGEQEARVTAVVHVPLLFTVVSCDRSAAPRVTITVLTTYRNIITAHLYSASFVSDIAIFVLKRDVKLKLTFEL